MSTIKRRYRLLRPLPGVKAGAVYEQLPDGDYQAILGLEATNVLAHLHQSIVEDNGEWFVPHDALLSMGERFRDALERIAQCRCPNIEEHGKQRTHFCDEDCPINIAEDALEDTYFFEP